MKLYVLKTTDPYLNLAIEEYLFRNSLDSIFILWQNDKTVVIGKNQNAYCEVNSEYAKLHGIKIARRITGGGAVYHDLGNINYSFISKSISDGIDFKTFTGPIISLLKSLSVDAELSGRNDIMVGDRKISGNAQFSSGGKTLHHGTILFDSDLSVLTSVLNVDLEKIKSKAIKSTRSRVINLQEILEKKLSASDFISLLVNHVIKEFAAELCDVVEMNNEIKALYDRNSSEEWIYPARDYLSSYTVKNKKRYDFGTVETDIEMLGERIEGVKIHGDFFGNKSIEELEKAVLKNGEFRLDGINVSDYVFGMTNDDFLSLITKGE